MDAYVPGDVNERVEKCERNLRNFREPLRVCRVLNDRMFDRADSLISENWQAETGKLPAKCYHKTLFLCRTIDFCTKKLFDQVSKLQRNFSGVRHDE